MDFNVNYNINVYAEMMAQAASGNIAAVVPLRGPDNQPMTFMIASDPTKDPAFNIREWAYDGTDYSGMYEGADYFGTDGIGIKYAMAMIQYAHYITAQQGLDKLFDDGSDS